MMTLEDAKEVLEKNLYNIDSIEVSTDEAGFNNEESLEIYLFGIDTLQMSEDSYKEFETLCDGFEREIKRSFDTLNAYATYDVSGYDYWTNGEKESNYCIVIVSLTDETQVEDIVRFSEKIDELYDSIVDLYDID